MAIPPSGYQDEIFTSMQDITHMPPTMIERARDRRPNNTEGMLDRLVKALEKKNAVPDLGDEKISNNEKRDFDRKIIKTLEEIKEAIEHSNSHNGGLLDRTLKIPHLHRRHKKNLTSKIEDEIEDNAGSGSGRGRKARNAEREAIRDAEKTEGKVSKAGRFSRLGSAGKGLLKAGGVLAATDAAFGLYNDRKEFQRSRGHAFLGDNTGFKNSGAYATGREALRGAEFGAGVGSIIPGVGTIAGAGIGAVGGSLYGLYEQYDKQINGMVEATGKKSLQYLNDAEGYMLKKLPSWEDYVSKAGKEIESGHFTEDLIGKVTGFIGEAFQWIESKLPSMKDLENGVGKSIKATTSAIMHPIDTAKRTEKAISDGITDSYQMGERAYSRADTYLTGKHQSFDPAILEAQAVAAKTTGVSRDYLDTAAQLESSGGKRGFASTSSAKGTYQFIDSTWNSMYKKYGKQYGLVDNALDPRSNAIMGALYARDNKDSLKKNLGYDPSNAEMYMAHFLGVGGKSGGATQLITRAKTDPDADAAQLFPSAASANKAIFYNPDGSSRTVKQVYDNIQNRWDAGTKAANKNIGITENSMGVDANGVITKTGKNAVDLSKAPVDAKATTAPDTTKISRDKEATPSPAPVSSTNTDAKKTDSVTQDITKDSINNKITSVHRNLSDWAEVTAKRSGMSEGIQKIARETTGAAVSGYNDINKMIEGGTSQKYLDETVSRVADYLKKQGIDSGSAEAPPVKDSGSAAPPSRPASSTSGVLRLSDMPMFIQDSGLVLVNMGHAS